MKILQITILALILIPSQVFSQQKNVLFIAVDDLKPLLGAYGDELAVTPNFDRLADMGVTFTNGHCQQAVCGPSRASLLTGMRPDVTEVWDLKTMIRDRNPDILTLPQHFKNNGYTTVGMGKIYDPRSVDKGYDKISWSVPYMMPDKQDPVFADAAMGSYQSPEYKQRFAELEEEGKSKNLTGGKLNKYIRDNFKPSTESADVPDEAYFDGQVAKTAVEQMGVLAKAGNPFFLAIGFKKPHLPFVAPKNYWDLYDRDDMPVAEFQQHASNTIEIPYHNNGELRSYTDIDGATGVDDPLQIAKQKELIHGYYACVSYIDTQLGKVLDALESNGLKENTTIVLWGDHGWHLGDHGLWNKHTNFEQATRVPLIFVDPDAKQSLQNDSPVEFVDIFPTLCDLAGIETPEKLQGTSLKPILDGKRKSVKDFAVSQFGRGKNMGYALRNDRYRLVVWYKDGDTSSDGNILFKELYDYKKDPLEKHNVVADYPELADELIAKLSAHLKESKVFKTANKKETKGPKVKKPKNTVKQTGDNFIKNGGFEEGEQAWNTFGQCPIAVVENDAFSGNAALQFDGSKGGASQMVKNLKPETTYEITVMTKTPDKEAVILKVADFGGEEIKEKYKESTYGELKAVFTTGKGVTSAKVVLQKYSEGSGKSYFDQVILKEKKSPVEMIQGQSLKSIIDQKYPGFYLGATIAYNQLGTDVQSILTSQFNYTVAENAGKQSKVHPEPGKWDWEQIDAILDLAEKNNITVRLHGPISPQASRWARADERTPKELEQVMIEYMTEQCKRYNGHIAVKWMDVVNETVETDGSWFSPKSGIAEWENPWTIIGSDSDKNQTPIYISRAFEIANEFAPDVKLVYNQHGGMEPVMWERVKETILYLRKKGLRVDGIGWQAHLRSDKELAFDQSQLDYLADLIDWAHQNKLGFHVTEIDYKIWDGQKTSESLQAQADAYANILKVILSKRKNGEVTYNSWGIVDGVGKHADKFQFMFEESGKPKPAFYAIQKTLLNPDEAPKVIVETSFFEDGFESNWSKGWKKFGDSKPEITSQNAFQGKSAVVFSGDKSGMKLELADLKPQTTYEVEVMVNATAGLKVALKAQLANQNEPIVSRTKGKGKYQPVTLTFETDNSTTGEIVITRWTNEVSGEAYIDAFKIIELAQ